LTSADHLVFQRLTQAEVRRPEMEIAASLTEEAAGDPLGDAG
jgi:hypothetical protein